MGLQPALSRILPPPVERIYDTDAGGPAEAQYQAMQRATESARALHATAVVDGLKFSRPLFAGIPVLVRGAGRQHSGLYYVESVTHNITRDEYKQSVSLWRNAVGLTGAEVFGRPAGGRLRRREKTWKTDPDPHCAKRSTASTRASSSTAAIPSAVDG